MKKTSLLIIALVLLTGCNSKQKEATAKAVESLKKVQAGTQVGVNYSNYGQLLIDAKAKVNEASTLLPNGKLKDELNATMDAYQDAGQVWNEKIQQHDLYSGFGIGQGLIEKYSIPTTDAAYKPAGLTASSDLAMQVIWMAADTHLKNVDSLK